MFTPLLTHPTNRPNYAELHTQTHDGEPLVIAFSYETPIAFSLPHSGERHRRPNDWGPTTSRHFAEFTGHHRSDTREHPTGEWFERALNATLYGTDTDDV